MLLNRPGVEEEWLSLRLNAAESVMQLTAHGAEDVEWSGRGCPTLKAGTVVWECHLAAPPILVLAEYLAHLMNGGDPMTPPGQAS
jgi:hypothetical protein